MYPIPEDLSPADKNKLNSYLPIRNKGNDFKWDTITGMVLSQALKRQIKQYDFDDYRKDCQEKFVSKLDEPQFWQVIERMYFSSGQIFKISPLFLLFKVQSKGNVKAELGAANQRMGELFASMLGNYFFANDVKDNLNFVEQDMLEVLRKRLEQASPLKVTERPYLPYLADKFREDIRFLASKPQYLLQELTNTLKLYAFAYCSQLALNISEWKFGEPNHKHLYFILDTEKASSERISVQKYGYKLFSSASERLFPLLSALENLQSKDDKRPLWQVYSDAVTYPDSRKLLSDLNRYITQFADSRDFDIPETALTIMEAFEQIQNLALKQFQDNLTTRSEVNKKYTKEIENQICSEFIQSRGRSGRILVLNQDQLLLLTNLTIGEHEKLRLHELIKEFEVRGFSLDNQSQLALVNFYERMGNVERMSDSGDAVYVRKTI